jgi:hypothetical protein
MTTSGSHSRTSRRGALRLLALALLSGCAGNPATPTPQDGLRVLFVGNSLTYWNGMPAMVEALARAAGERPLVWRQAVAPGFSLEDHWNDGGALAEIRAGNFEVVILQQGPSALASSRALLVEYAGRFAREVRNAAGRPALYMVWPEEARAFDFDGVSASYAAAAEAVDGMLMPAGEAWRAAWRRDGDLALYGPDRFHPSVLGSYIAAAVIFQRLYGRSPVGLPGDLDIPGAGRLGIDATTARLLQEAAVEAAAEFGR